MLPRPEVTSSITPRVAGHTEASSMRRLFLVVNVTIRNQLKPKQLRTSQRSFLNALKVGRLAFNNLYHLSWEDPPLLWDTPPGSSCK